MFIEKRREARVTGCLPVELVLRAKKSGASVCDPLPALIVNLSSRGACLLLESIRIDTYHFFYTPRDKSTLTLFLIADKAGLTDVAIPIWPVRFDRLLWEEAKPFEMGVEFLLPARDGQVQNLQARLLEVRDRSSDIREGFRLHVQV